MTSPDSFVPRRLTTVMPARITRQSGSACPCSAGTADVRAPTPAEIPTATFSM